MCLVPLAALIESQVHHYTRQFRFRQLIDKQRAGLSRAMDRKGNDEYAVVDMFDTF